MQYLSSKRSLFLIFVISILVIASAIVFYLSYYTEVGGGTTLLPLSAFPIDLIAILNQTGSLEFQGFVYVATSNSQQAQGFQNVTSFGNCNGNSVNETTQCVGMLFLSNSPKNLCFWMHNTPMPLLQSWIGANGTVIYTYNATAESDNVVCHNALNVLESRSNLNVVVGDRVQVESP